MRVEISVIIPAYNESSRLPATLTAVADYFDSLPAEYEIIVVDDGSADGTGRAGEEWSKSRWPEEGGRLRLLSLPHRGKGAAVAAGVAAARGRRLLMTDADLSTPISEWPKLAENLNDGAEVVIGSRQAAGAEIEQYQPWLRQQLGLLFGRVVRWLFPVGVIDTQCGFKAFEREVAVELFRGLQSSGYCFDVEVILRARARGYKVVEVPVRWRNHPESKVHVLRDWPRVAAELWRIRREMKSSHPGEQT